MSGALVSLVSKGAQDVYLMNEDGDMSFFKSKFTRYKNFSQAPKRLELSGPVQNNAVTSIPILSFGDLINNVWLEGSNLVTNLSGTTFELYMGGQLVDRQTFDYMGDVWQIYLAETYSKCQTINNNISQSNPNFFPLHFFFCDSGMFLPLVAIQYHQIEIRVTWGSSVQNANNIVAYGNYVFLDTKEREELVSKPQIDMLITQVQTIQGTLKTVDLGLLKHPVKSIFFGYPQTNNVSAYWSFTGASISLNGTPLLESMTPTYFHTVQGYYATKYGIINFNPAQNAPQYTRYFMYNFCLDATSYKPTGTCNFSRFDNARLDIQGATCTDPLVTGFTLYAVNYNILRIKSGISGILFSN